MADLTHKPPPAPAPQATVKPLYTVACSDTLGGMEREVRELMAHGWRPCGGVSALWTGGSFHFYQAMTVEGDAP